MTASPKGAWRRLIAVSLDNLVQHRGRVPLLLFLLTVINLIPLGVVYGLRVAGMIPSQGVAVAAALAALCLVQIPVAILINTYWSCGLYYGFENIRRQKTGTIIRRVFLAALIMVALMAVILAPYIGLALLLGTWMPGGIGKAINLVFLAVDVIILYYVLIRLSFLYAGVVAGEPVAPRRFWRQAKGWVASLGAAIIAVMLAAIGIQLVCQYLLQEAVSPLIVATVNYFWISLSYLLHSGIIIEAYKMAVAAGPAVPSSAESP